MRNRSTNLTTTLGHLAKTLLLSLILSGCIEKERSEETITETDATVTIEGAFDGKPVQLVVVHEQVEMETSEARTVSKPNAPQIIQGLDPITTLFGGGGLAAAASVLAYLVGGRRKENQTRALERRRPSPSEPG